MKFVLIATLLAAIPCTNGAKAANAIDNALVLTPLELKDDPTCAFQLADGEGNCLSSKILPDERGVFTSLCDSEDPTQYFTYNSKTEELHSGHYDDWCYFYNLSGNEDTVPYPYIKAGLCDRSLQQNNLQDKTFLFSEEGQLQDGNNFCVTADEMRRVVLSDCDSTEHKQRFYPIQGEDIPILAMPVHSVEKIKGLPHGLKDSTSQFQLINADDNTCLSSAITEDDNEGINVNPCDKNDLNQFFTYDEPTKQLRPANYEKQGYCFYYAPDPQWAPIQFIRAGKCEEVDANVFNKKFAFDNDGILYADSNSNECVSSFDSMGVTAGCSDSYYSNTRYIVKPRDDLPSGEKVATLAKQAKDLATDVVADEHDESLVTRATKSTSNGPLRRRAVYYVVK
ncbi:expressed unknown protein [Seminavis robusta]|uniref:Ricin B lectin domain-containing protein n=1 Tax=Seminavis robusta TaxID=568900 RepID=A0A9N8DD48_9STRA|nr:expressed unknown protein [Seminavis robusta]|eukprot:Sro40_g024550.1 n/a (396) ;mRNA; r:32271-33544